MNYKVFLPSFFWLIRLGLCLTLNLGWLFASEFQPEPAAKIKVWIALQDKGPLAPKVSMASMVAKMSSDQIFKNKRAWEDFPLYAPYLNSLENLGIHPLVKLLWQNQISAFIRPDQLEELKKLPGIASVKEFPHKLLVRENLEKKAWAAEPFTESSTGSLNLGQTQALFDSLRITYLQQIFAQENLLPGDGVKLAVIDVQFNLGNHVFDSLKIKKQIIDQWDFTQNDTNSVHLDSLGDSHGANCLSLIAGNSPGKMVGVSPSVQLLLYHAEVDETESYVEEDYVASAIERATLHGAQVMSISLGYRYDFDTSANFPYSQLDGKTLPASIAATKAAERDVVLTIAMGNEGTTHASPNISSPADADSILAVGIANTQRKRCSYSSTGPSFDGRIKPDLVSMGMGSNCAVPVANVSSLNGFNPATGTSFAAPVVAGVAALLRQYYPQATASEIRAALKNTSNLADHPNDSIGYGLIDVNAAWKYLKQNQPIPPHSPNNWHSLAYNGLGILFLPSLTNPLFAPTLIDLKGKVIPFTLRHRGNIYYAELKYLGSRGILLAHFE